MKGLWLFLTLVLLIYLILPSVLAEDASHEDHITKGRSSFHKGAAIPDPLLQRAVGFQDKGKFKMSVGNWGLLTGTGYSPEGLWGNYQYIPVISLVFGVPGRDENGNPYPWAVGRKYVYDFDERDLVPRGTDTTYWGPTVSEAWFDRTPNLDHTDWEAVEDHSERLHGEATAGQYYGDIWTDLDDQFPLIATSDIVESWPILVDSTGEEASLWPGPWATDTTGAEIEGQFVSDQDIYFEFDDRLATRDVDPDQGYPMFVRAKVSAYSYGASVAEDIIFFNMVVVNESEYDYERTYGGFYYDGDSYHRKADGSYGGRTNDDDMMGFNNEWDFAFIHDLDDMSTGSGSDRLAWTALKLLDTPLATEPVDIDGDGSIDIQVGEELGLTDWHYFDWYFRPGSRDESQSGPFSGDGETAVADDKEAIQYKIMAGDTSQTDSKVSDHSYNQFHFFHPDPAGNLNRHFDSFASLKADYPDGLDCVFIMSSGPFTLQSGDSIPFSFAVIAGEDSVDLVANAEIAQLMYDNFYRGPTPPQAPNLSVLEEDEKITLFWDDISINSRDALTKVKDFEGFRIYKSTDNGRTWGEERYDDSTRASYWTPIAQFDLDDNIQGHDPTAPHRFLGDNSGLQFRFVDEDVRNGVEYLYAVSAYDWGFIADNPVRDPDSVTQGRFRFRLQSLENFLSNSERLPHIVRAIPHRPPSNTTQEEVQISKIDTTKGNGQFNITVVDVAQLTGDDYIIFFHGSPTLGNVNFDLIDMTTGDSLLKNSKQFIVIDPSAQFKTIPPRIHGLEWEIRTAIQPLVDAENIEWIGDCDYEVSAAFSNKVVGDYFLVFKGGNASNAYKPNDTTTVIFTVPFEVWNTLSRSGDKLVPRKATIYVVESSTSQQGVWSSGDKFFLLENHLVNRPPTQNVLSLNFQIDWHDTAYFDPNTQRIQPPNIPWEVGDTLKIPVFVPFQEGDGYIIKTDKIYQIGESKKEDIKKVRVVPNPYIVTAEWEFDEFSRKIQFQNLPSQCTIYIFNVAGELVQTLHHDNVFDGSEDWNLWTSNRQEVAPGLYIWVVETPDGNKDMGKFAIIR